MIEFPKYVELFLIIPWFVQRCYKTKDVLFNGIEQNRQILKATGDLKSQLPLTASNSITSTHFLV